MNQCIDAWQRLEHEIITCRLCPRLVEWREEVAHKKRRAYIDWDYWGKPVPGFGDKRGRVLVVGLAPGAHGSNRTGRMFTGDSSGRFLYRAIHKAGFANQPISTHRDDNLILNELFISAVCRCVPPKNKPTLKEINNCRRFLEREVILLDRIKVVVVLGRIAFDSVLQMYNQLGRGIPRLRFSHGSQYHIEENPLLIASYHPSQQNTQTGRLSESMFDQIWLTVRSILE